jgi:hypothetical protein
MVKPLIVLKDRCQVVAAQGDVPEMIHETLLKGGGPTPSLTTELMTYFNTFFI